MGRGGVRWGAGRPGWYVKAEHCLRIDLRRWHRLGLLKPGTASGWAWSNPETDDRLGYIDFSVTEYRVTLSYSINATPRRQDVPLYRTTCNYGGVRPWFGCPGCSRRVAVLFLRSNGFGCRHCQRIAYASQSEDACGRAWRRQAKLEARLSPDWERPKGMHQLTYERLLERLSDCEDARDAALELCLARVMHLL